MDGSQLTLDVDPEEWRLVDGWSDYEVSSLGRVRRATDTFWKNSKNGKMYIQYRRGRMLSLVDRGKGYLFVCLKMKSRKKYIPVAVLVCMTFNGPPPSAKHEVAHGDGSRDNNRADNLSWKTHKENCADKLAHGTAQRGSKNPASKLTEDQVREIRGLLDTTYRQVAAIARRYGISAVTAHRIKSREVWGWLPD